MGGEEKKGKVFELLGDGIQVKTCREVKQYNISWSQKINDTCYHLYPMKSPELGEGFLELNTRAIFRHSHKIKCTERSKVIYLRDVNGVFWEKRLRMPFKRIHAKIRGKESLDIELPHLSAFNEKIIHYKQAIPHRITLLNLVAQQQENLHQLYDYQNEGGTLTNGITGAIATTIDGVEEVGKTLINSISKGITNTVKIIGNSTEGLIEATGQGVSEILDSIGGVPTLVLALVDIGIITYLVLQRRRRQRPNRPVIEVQRPPPVEFITTPLDVHKKRTDPGNNAVTNL